MGQSLAPKFRKTATEAYKAFPGELARLVVLLLPDGETPVYVSPQVADQLTESAAIIKGTAQIFARKLEHLRGQGGAIKDYDLAGTKVDLILVKDVDGTSAYSDPRMKMMETIFFLDHEIGHHILRNGYSTDDAREHLGECSCDAFAMLRHIQRFGKNTGFAKEAANVAASNIVMEAETAHYTSDALERAIKVANDRGDAFFTLSLQETAALAADIADECHLDEQRLDKICNAYQPVAQACSERSPLTFVAAFDVMDKHRNDPDIFNAGKRLLNTAAVKSFMKETAAEKIPALEKNELWQKTLRFIEAQEQETNGPQRKTSRTLKQGRQP